MRTSTLDRSNVADAGSIVISVVCAVVTSCECTNDPKTGHGKAKTDSDMYVLKMSRPKSHAAASGSHFCKAECSPLDN